MSIMQLRDRPARVKVAHLPVERIAPNRSQPRKVFEEQSLRELALSIEQHGVLQPLLVRPADTAGRYELIMGERRLRAARLIGLKQVPCIIRSVSDETSSVYALIENLQRQDLNYFEEAQAIGKLILQYGLTQEAVAGKLGRSQPSIANKLRLLRLSPIVREQLVAGGLTERHARALLRLQSEAQQLEAIDVIIKRQLRVMDAEKLIGGMLVGQPPEEEQKPRSMFIVKDIRLFINTINHAVSVMKQAGIGAESTKTETPEFIEYVIKIPRTTT